VTLKNNTLLALSSTGWWAILAVAYFQQFYNDDAWWAAPFILTQILVVFSGIGVSLWAVSILIKRFKPE